MDHYYEISARSSYQDSLKVLDADIQHANALAASIPKGKGGSCLQMKPVCSAGKPKISACRRKASIKEFYSVILPSLQRLHGDSMALDTTQESRYSLEIVSKKSVKDWKFLSNIDIEREDECGICLEPYTKMVVPNCCHALCINCYHDWNTRSESCPFCRGSLKRVNSGDLWVLTCSNDMVDTNTVLNEDLLRFHLYMNSLPKDIPDALFLMYYEYLI